MNFELQAQGQRFLSSWEDLKDLDEDTLYLKERLGSIKEYNFQTARAYDDKHYSMRIQFIDAKYSYVVLFAPYMERLGVCSNTIEIENLTNRIIFTLRGCNVGLNVHPVKLDVKLDKDNRITQVDIIGASQHLLKIFKHQWWISEDDMRAVRKGAKFTVSRWDEKVTFDWRQVEPVIKIRNNGMGNLRRIIERNK